ncbi:hypothetical protein Y032_0014g2394 [Ancylostoma ceylanicum]|uniref:Uncharacterized protein n=1 Tax=Ancylostoma ceylanicum TaxID=53326 RepID=A0A016V998_9BILA|nr:hypothetical protein Y032_0014g2394 [Ancylostoma ceylanicum]
MPWDALLPWLHMYNTQPSSRPLPLRFLSSFSDRSENSHGTDPSLKASKQCDSTWKVHLLNPMERRLKTNFSAINFSKKKVISHTVVDGSAFSYRRRFMRNVWRDS